MVKEMCRVLQHGGPDDEGIYSSPADNLVLGNRRLALLDLSAAGHQPMSYANGRLHITYNGELYNFPDLKKELIQKGYSFISNSDTEVILASFSEWGIKAFEKFNGMFAFALLDSQHSTLYLVRDAAGIKPLYYAVNNEQLVFGSEIKAFRSIPNLQAENAHWPIYMMAYGHLPEPVTPLHYVTPLAKGTYLQYHLHDGKCNISTYNNFSYSDAIKDKTAAISLIKECLPNAVKRHLLSDAPIGVFLSGGIDSSIMALLANEKTNGQLNTLSLYFSENQYSEKKYQDMVLQRLSCVHHQHLLSEQEFHQHLPKILSSMDIPSTDGINTWFISKYAKEIGLKAVLSGVGGDELFGGYPSFKRMNNVNMLEKLPKKILKNAAVIRNKKLRRLSYLSLGGAKGKYLFLRGHFIPVEIARQLDVKESQVWEILKEQPQLVNIDSLSPFDQAGWMEMNLYMQNQLLRDSDVMSMSHGVEIRVPFLDKEFIKLSLQIQSSIKQGGGFSKQLLIDSFKDILPEPIWNRPKMGFSFPFKEWLAKDELVKESMFSANGETKINYEKFLSSNLHWSQLLTLVLLHKNINA
jgi:asparagine synthase (glutamine-hydrolysing)